MLNKVIDVLCNYTNWKTPYFHNEKTISFLLENNMELFLFVPNNEQIIFYTKLAKLPTTNIQNFITFIAEHATGMYKIRKSIISITENTLTLHQIIYNNQFNQTNIINTVTELLNDTTLWKNLIANIH